MSEPEKTQRSEIVEKRVTGTVIRRRAKKVVEKPPEKESAPAVAEDAVKSVAPEPTVETPTKKTAKTKPAPEPQVVAKEAAEVEESKVESKEEKTSVLAEKLEPPEEKAAEKAKAKRGPKVKRTKDDLLMDEYERAGGLKQVAVEATIEDATDDVEVAVVPEPMERLFKPERQQRRGKRVTGRKDFKKTVVTTPSAKKRKIRVNENITVADFANAMSIKGTDVMKKLIGMGTMVTLNDRIDVDTAEIIAGEYGFEIENVSFKEEEFIPSKKQEDVSAEALEPRAPVVTVMGHVDHGKTSLLDYIRKEKVAAGEAGGITQHIGAYQVQIPRGTITFVDTPGHEAFTSMRARGAQVTDIVVLVVAADDGVKPQTIEALDHARAAEVPIIVAINKMDAAGANPDDVKRQLAEQNLLAEDWGGEVIMVPVSAHTGEGIETLLEMLVLQAEMLELKANPNKLAEGFVIEARLEKGRGPLCSVIVKEGTLRKGDPIVAGIYGGRVRAMHDSTGKDLKEAGPSMAVELIGLSGVPGAGDDLHALANDDDVKRVVGYRKEGERSHRLASQKTTSIDDLFLQIKEGERTELKVVIKADVQGSIEALKASLEQLTTEKVTLSVIHSSVGAVTESDVMLAEASRAMIVGFNVSPDSKARKMAESMGVTIKIYRVIYEAIDEVKKAMEGLLAPTFEEEYLGRAEVRDIFNVSKAGTIAGSFVVDGKITRGCNIRVVRDGAIVYEGKISSLKRFKEDAKEVAQGYECGIGVENFNDIKVGDVLESYQMKQIASTL